MVADHRVQIVHARKAYTGVNKLLKKDSGEISDIKEEHCRENFNFLRECLSGREQNTARHLGSKSHFDKVSVGNKGYVIGNWGKVILAIKW